MSQEQLETIKRIGTCMLVSASNDGMPHCTIVEPSFYTNSEIDIPIVQMKTTIRNIKQNPKIFIHVTDVNKEYYGDSTQYKIEASAIIEKSGELFKKVKHYEETERLPEGWTVKGVVRAILNNCEKVDG